MFISFAEKMAKYFKKILHFFSGSTHVPEQVLIFMTCQNKNDFGSREIETLARKF